LALDGGGRSTLHPCRFIPEKDLVPIVKKIDKQTKTRKVLYRQEKKKVNQLWRCSTTLLENSSGYKNSKTSGVVKLKIYKKFIVLFCGKE
jgi:hypothetical protein